jgi:hypothetical protein
MVLKLFAVIAVVVCVKPLFINSPNPTDAADVEIVTVPDEVVVPLPGISSVVAEQSQSPAVKLSATTGTAELVINRTKFAAVWVPVPVSLAPTSVPAIALATDVAILNVLPL